MLGLATFYLQARGGGRTVSVALEKVQVAVLAERLGELLGELRRRGVTAAADPSGGEDTAPLDSPVEEEFARPLRVVAVPRGMGIWADMGIEQINFVVLKAGEGVVDVGPSLPQGLDFAPLQHQSRLEEVVNGVFEVGLAVAADNFHGVFFHYATLLARGRPNRKISGKR